MKPELLVSGAAPNRARLIWTALACSLAAFVLGARWAVASSFGTSLPVLDQWDAEAACALQPWLRGEPLIRALFHPHNEHYPVLTKLLNLGLALLNGQWDQHLQCVVNAGIPAFIAVVFFRWGRAFVPTAFVPVSALFLAAAYGLPLAWENVVSGFHSQQFFLIGLSLGIIALLPFSRPWSLRWFAGAACASLALLSMASGFFAGAVAVALVAVRWIMREARLREVWPTLLIGLAVCAAGWLTRNEVGPHAGLRARDAHDFLLAAVQALQWPARLSGWLAMIIWLPWVWLSVRLFTRREADAGRIQGWILFGLGLWVMLQIAATAYARGAGGPAPVSRYLDTLVFGCAVNFFSIAWLWSARASLTLSRTRVIAMAMVWLGVFGAGAFFETRQSLNDLQEHARAQDSAMVQVREYLATGDLKLLEHPDSPYPVAGVLAERLSHRELVAFLPPRARASAPAPLSPGDREAISISAGTAPLSRVAIILSRRGTLVAAIGLAGLALFAVVYWLSHPRPQLGIRAELPHLRQAMADARRSVVLRGLAALFVIGVLMPFLPQRLVGVRPLSPLTAGESPAIGESAWEANAVAAGKLPSFARELARRGSWVGGDAFTGEHVTGWYRAVSPVGVLVAGYPLRAPNQLAAEVRHRDGSVTTLVFAGKDPTEKWIEWVLALPADAEALRLRGVDATTVWGGWLAFSEPYSRPLLLGFDVRGTLRTISVVALALLLVLGPGIVWRNRRKSDLTCLLWVGPSWLVLGGGLCWALGGAIAPDVVATVWVGATILAIAWFEYRYHVWAACSAFEKRILALVALCVLGAAAKAAFSGGPRGELYGGLVSRTLEVGARSDSRISFHGVQLIAHHLSPYEPEGAKYYDPWLFSARGPFAGLAAAPTVLATGGRPPLDMPDQPWAPFDQQGFATYRITLSALASLSLVAVVALLARVTDERRAWLGATLLALSPFFWHEVYFTWPKLMAAAWVIGGFHALLHRRPAAAGVWLAGAYLCHPLALLSVPFCGLWILGACRPIRTAFSRLAIFGGVVLLGIAAWQLLNAGHSGQTGFLHYFLGADGGAGLRGWLLSRWNSAANTLVPFYVLAFNSAHPAFNALTEPSSGWIRFFLQYWTAAPFAVGIVTWAALLPAFGVAIRRQPAVAALTLFGPLLFLIVYWGAFSTGLMREGGHVLFFTGWIFLVWSAADRVPRWISTGAFAALRGLEVLAMMFLPAFVDGTRNNAWLLNDATWLLVAIGCVATTAGLASRPFPLRMGEHSRSASPSSELQLEQTEGCHP